MATDSSILARRIPGQRSLVGCRLWGHTESDTTDLTQQQQHSILQPYDNYLTTHENLVVSNLLIFTLLQLITLHMGKSIHSINSQKWGCCAKAAGLSYTTTLQTEPPAAGSSVNKFFDLHTERCKSQMQYFCLFFRYKWFMLLLLLSHISRV